MRPDIKRLEAFVAIAEELSVTRAAERLGRAQPMVSQQLKDLEADLGIELFQRSRGKLGPLSRDGERLLGEAREFVAACARMAGALRGLREDNRRRVVIGVEPISLHIPRRNELVRRFLMEQGIDLLIVTRTPAELFAGLESGEFDLILTCLPAPLADVEMIEIHQAKMQLALPRGTEAIGRNDLSGTRLMTMPETFHPAHHWWVEDQLADYGFEWTDSPENSFEALVHYALSLGIGTVSVDFSDGIVELASAMELRDIFDPPLIVRWALMRFAENKKLGVRKLWKVAEQFSQSGV